MVGEDEFFGQVAGVGDALLELLRGDGGWAWGVFSAVNLRQRSSPANSNAIGCHCIAVAAAAYSRIWVTANRC